MNSKPKIEDRKAQPYAAVRMQVPIPFGKYLQPAWSKVHGWLATQQLSHGPAIIRYLTTDMSTKLDIEVGFALEQKITGGEGILTDVLPAGRYATLLYTGSYRGKGVYNANVAIIEWAKATGVTWKTTQHDGVEWWDSRVEWYLTNPDSGIDPKKYQTELAFMVANEK
jgi:effector-binding domain-containing protein